MAALKSFKNWKREEVQKTFKLKRRYKMDLMTQWLNIDINSISDFNKKEIEKLQRKLIRYGSDWNEATLKFLFLGPLMHLIDFNMGLYNAFLEHELTAYLGENTISGKVDFMVAQGEQIPIAPFFCLHEYKPEKGTDKDPFGQLLIAMVAAQQANEKENLEIPIYGLYLLGNIFYFVLLHGKDYMRSPSYDAAQSDIYEIFAILEKTKSYVQQILPAEALST